MHSSNLIEHVFFKLVKNEPLYLIADDIINIGCIDLQLQRFNAGLASNKGTRHTMEDAHVIIHDLGISYFMDVSLFAVFDGHGGDDCVKYVSK